MKPTYLITIGLLLTALMACNSTKTSSATSQSESNMESEKMMAEGYSAGTIVLSNTEGDCPVTIQLDGTQEEVYYDPIELDDTYKSAGMKVWFKFSGLRMMNRCEKANPIRIESIKKREQ